MQLAESDCTLRVTNTHLCKWSCQPLSLYKKCPWSTPILMRSKPKPGVEAMKPLEWWPGCAMAYPYGLWDTAMLASALLISSRPD
jgi:hypothetical protein